jgi:hypothetical protein
VSQSSTSFPLTNPIFISVFLIHEKPNEKQKLKNGKSSISRMIKFLSTEKDEEK